MWPYTDEENTWLQDGGRPQTISDNRWPGPDEVQYHLRNGAIMRAEAVGEATIFAMRLLRNAWRRIGNHLYKLRQSRPGRGATA